MSIIITFGLSFVFFFGPMNSNPAVEGFDLLFLSEDGRKAYENLLHASQFEDSRVGYTGALSVYARNLETLLNEQNADAAFKSLLTNAKTAGKLYALCGLFYTDYDSFEKEIESFRLSKETVTMVSGCEVYDESVSAIIESRGQNVAIIGPGESLEQYLTGSKGRSYNIDIANGGYPATFRHFAKQEKEKTN